MIVAPSPAGYVFGKTADDLVVRGFAIFLRLVGLRIKMYGAS
jgi:hypothetical protein